LLARDMPLTNRPTKSETQPPSFDELADQSPTDRTSSSGIARQVQLAGNERAVTPRSRVNRSDLQLRDQRADSGSTWRRVLDALPTRFGIAEANEDYVAGADRNPTIDAYTIIRGLGGELVVGASSGVSRASESRTTRSADGQGRRSRLRRSPKGERPTTTSYPLSRNKGTRKWTARARRYVGRTDASERTQSRSP